MTGLDVPDPDESMLIPRKAVIRCDWVPAKTVGAGSPMVEGAIRLGIESSVGWKPRRVRMLCLLILSGKIGMEHENWRMNRRPTMAA
jgi:hypothetical protein